MSERKQFVERALALPEGEFSALCREFGISRPTGYKWLRRYQAEGEAGLREGSRRPHTSPTRTPAAAEAAVLALRAERPAWGARKLHRVLQRQGVEGLPAISTVNEILRRNGCIDEAESAKHRPFQRFERDAPNELWQMDFKGHFALLDGTRCHPLTVLDDHSRFNLCLQACPDQKGTTVQARLKRVFAEYGLPDAMLMDNGSPWGNTPEQCFTPLVIWLMRLDVLVLHGRPYHPQTQGKEERFHRTMDAELLSRLALADPRHCQEHFDRYRGEYNEVRPHEALGMEVPASRYRPSERPLPARLPKVEYAPGEVLRTVQQGGRISFRGHVHRVPRAFRGLAVALRPTGTDGELGAFFGHHRIGTLDLKYLLEETTASSGSN